MVSKSCIMYSEIRSASKTWVYKHTPGWESTQMLLVLGWGLEGSSFLKELPSLLILACTFGRKRTNWPCAIHSCHPWPSLQGLLWGVSGSAFLGGSVLKKNGLPRQFSKLSLKHNYSLNSKCPLLSSGTLHVHYYIGTEWQQSFFETLTVSKSSLNLCSDTN